MFLFPLVDLYTYSKVELCILMGHPMPMPHQLELNPMVEIS